MDETLPGPARLILNQALAQWQQWQPAPATQPEPQRLLGAGGSNTSVLVSDGSRQWVLRIDGFDSQRMGLSRDAEWRALHNAAGVQLAPQPVYRNPSLGVLVCEYCEPQAGAADSLAGVAALLRRIHALPPVKFRLDPLQRARGYLSVIGERELPTALVEACEKLEPAELKLCHNDLLCANRLVFDNRMLALDWEYAAMGDPLFDLAVIIEGDSLTDDEADALHEAWQDATPDEESRERLAHQRIVYRELAALWERALPAVQRT
ncbi:MAG: phosphotransferase [Halieaceae bacterium]|jgi:aminoglycoside phosphotransferase (APT) family kinase protein|nr:phosphotransferase [Halieaceae bacterium]